MSRHHLLAWAVATLIVPATLASAGTTSVALGARATAAKAHHKHKHKKAKPKHHKTTHHKTTHHQMTSPKSTKLEECSTTISGSGPILETNTYDYQVILACSRGEFSSFSVSTNRAIAAGSITAQIGADYKYSCQQTSSTSFSCSGVTVAIPSGEEGAVRAFFKSTQPVCEGSASETATITTEGETFNAKLGEAQSPC